MSCKDKYKFKTAEASSKASLRTKGAIDKFLNILDVNLFNKLNKIWSEDAVKRFNIIGRLFLNDNGKAVANKIAFKKIDSGKGIFYQINNNNNNTLIKEGVNDIFETNSELANIGTQEQYSQYLDSIFPDSKVKDIVYHSTIKEFDNFDKNFIRKSNINAGVSGSGFYFTPNKDFANKTARLIYGSSNIKFKISLVNVSKPYTHSENQKNELGYVKFKYIGDITNNGNLKETTEFTENIIKNGYDSVIETYENKDSTSEKEIVVFEPEQIHILGSKQDIEGFNNFVKKENTPAKKFKENEVNFVLKAIDILQSDKAKQVFEKGQKNSWDLNRILTELQVPKEQKQLLLDLNISDREQLALELVSKYSYSVEINTAKEIIGQVGSRREDLEFTVENLHYASFRHAYKDEFVFTKNTKNITKEEYDVARGIFKKEYDITALTRDSRHYSNLAVPGGTNYTENEISTPLITPSIKGHAQFSTDNGIGWFRGDEKYKTPFVADNDYESDVYRELGYIRLQNTSKPTYIEPTSKTRRILEVQSDLFQKGRDKNDLTSDKIENVSDWVNQNKFLQLLNKDNNWVTFFVKSIIQDSSKKGYEKVLFPTGDTAAKIEGHSTLEGFKKEKEDRIKQLVQEKNKYDESNFIVHRYNEFDSSDKTFAFKNIDDANSFLSNKSLSRKESPKQYYSLPKDNRDVIEATTANLTKEINQLKQELERVETEGFGALKPIYNFYENTVTNILKKQGYNAAVITDEYGNTWNEVTIESQRDTKTITLKKAELNQSAASKETLTKVKAIINKLGINLITLEKYLKGNPDIDAKGVDGLADLVKGVIAIATGRESEALTEEMVHIATAILEQTNPQLITSLISKIDRFQIYKKTLEIYKKNKNYQLADGKPDIRKIKKEAVDKLIAEYIINNSEGSDQFPELRDLEARTFIQEMWDAITAFIRQLYSKAEVNLFEELAKNIIDGKIEGSVEDLRGSTDGTMFQIAESLVEKTANIFKEMNKNMKLVDASATEQRHYTYEENGKEEKLKYTVSTINGKKEIDEKDPILLKKYDQQRGWGSEGHAYIEKYIKNNLIDENGLKLATPKNIIVTSPLNQVIKENLINFCKNLINSYEEGTIFLIETLVVNKKISMGSAIDFMAIEPIINKKGEPDVRIDILDWKFTSLDKSRTSDIIYSKKQDWVRQMGEYSKILYNAGVSRNMLRKARMLPFISNYRYAIEGDNKSGLVLSSLEIGKINTLDETNLYLLPTVLPSESTGNESVDNLVQSLNKLYEKLRKRGVSDDKKYLKTEKLKEISAAIKKLHLQLNFTPLFNVAKSFLKDAQSSIKEYKNIDFKTLSKEELKTKLEQLIDYQKSANKFINLDEIYLSHLAKEDLTPEQEKLINDFRRVSGATNTMLKEITNLQKVFIAQLAFKYNISDVENDEELFTPEKEIGSIDRNFLESSKLSPVLIKLATKLWRSTRSLVNVQFSKVADSYQDILVPLEKEAKALGKTAFDMIGVKTDEDIKLIIKLSKEFKDKLKKAREEKNKEELLKHIDLAKFTELTDSYIISTLKKIENSQYTEDEEENQNLIAYYKSNFVKSIDISSADFKGFKDFSFINYYNQALIENEKNYSQEYVTMSKSENAIKMWKFFTALNERGKKAGYLDKKSLSFFPLIEGTFLQKIANSKDKAATFKDFFKDLYTINTNEEKSFAKIDEETGEVLKAAPKYFKATNKPVSALSTDLNKVGLLYIKTIMDYEAASDLEFTMMTIHAVEQNKETIITDEQNIPIMENSNIKTKKENKNAETLQVLIDDYIYGIQENLNSLGNAVLNNGLTKNGDDNKTVSFKKGLKTADTYLRQLAIGLKPLLGISNFSGGIGHSFITSNDYYSFSSFIKNTAKLFKVKNGLTLIEKALINKFLPLNGENPVLVKQRELGNKISLKNYLNTWTIQDVMMSTNSFGERKLELANAISMMQNSIVINGKILNINKYLKAQDRESKKGMSEVNRFALAKSFDARAEELRNSENSLIKLSSFESDDVFIVKGVSDEEAAFFRIKIIDIARNANGQMDNDDKMGYRRDTLFNSFMMFKGWIPKLLSTRYKEITKNTITDDWEYGRYKAFYSCMSEIGFKNITDLRDIITGSDKGLAIISNIFQEKQDAYFRKTGKRLTITEEEFQDLLREQVSNMMRELALIVSLLGILVAARLGAPDDDDDDLTKNRYKYFAKGINKISDELLFYVNPASADEMTKGSIIPALGLLSKVSKLFSALGKEVYYDATGDEKAADKVYPVKYFINLFPGSSQVFNEVLPNTNPELYKELGGKVTSQSRRQ